VWAYSLGDITDSTDCNCLPFEFGWGKQVQRWGSLTEIHIPKIKSLQATANIMRICRKRCLSFSKSRKFYFSRYCVFLLQTVYKAIKTYLFKLVTILNNYIPSFLPLHFPILLSTRVGFRFSWTLGFPSEVNTGASWHMVGLCPDKHIIAEHIISQKCV
jgi:hypothetical protein